MSKLLFIGIDALDSVQVDRLADDLPNLTRLRQQGYYTRFGSIWPPDSETVWSTIYTGWNPARHGIFQFVDPLQKTATYIAQERNNAVFRHHTFWDLAGAAGKKTSVLFPHVGYPSWPVNGVMMTRSSLTKELSVAPEGVLDGYDLNGLNEVKGLAGRKKQAYVEANKALVERQLELSLQLMRTQAWDLFFTYWSSLDLIQHQFWSHHDPADPTHPGETPFLHTIRDFYVLHDRMVGQLLAEVDEETSVIVMSDHGHGMRPVQIFNINRLLREHGFLTLKHNTQSAQVDLLKQLKNRATDFVGRHELGGLAARALRLAPWTKKLYVSAADINFSRTLAYTTDMSGIKAYSYGGIRIARQNLQGRSYTSVCEEIMELLMQARAGENGSGGNSSGENSSGGNDGVPLVQWIKQREELYDGPFLEEYPDLIFDLHPDYGVGWDARGPLFDVSHSHNLYPGSHIGANAVFSLTGPAARSVSRDIESMMDVAPTVLDILEVPTEVDFDGESILGNRKVRSGQAPVRAVSV